MRKNDQNNMANDLWLDELLDHAAKTPPPLRAEFSDQILHDAFAAQDAMAPPRSALPSGGLWSQLRDVFGGWGPVGSLVTAGIIGVWIGVAPPAIAGDPMAYFYGDTDGYSFYDPDDVLLSLSEDSQ